MDADLKQAGDLLPNDMTLYRTEYPRGLALRRQLE